MAADEHPAQPTLTTRRLILRPFTAADAPDVRRLAGDPEIADTTLHIPHPYGPGIAETWIATHDNSYAKGTGAVFAVTDRAGGELIGSVGLVIDPATGHAGMGGCAAHRADVGPRYRRV